MRRKSGAGELFLLLIVVLLMGGFGLGFVVILPDLQMLRADKRQIHIEQIPRVQEPLLATWALPPTWTPGENPTFTPTVTPIVLRTQLPWPTAPLVPTGIVPATSLVQPTETDFLVIGKSAGGHSLEVFRFGDGPEGRMIVAGIHGGYEWNTIALADQLITHLRQHPETIPLNISLYILRSLNPDGAALGHGPEGHNNAHGVDLNRNWDANWQATWPRNGCYRSGPVSAGPKPMSEPETQALMKFLASHPITALVSYHSAAPGIYASGDPPHPDSKRLAQALSTASGYNFPGPITGCVYTGTLVDWAYQVLGIPAVDVELTDHYGTDFRQNLRLLGAFLNWIR